MREFGNERDHEMLIYKQCDFGPSKFVYIFHLH